MHTTHTDGDVGSHINLGQVGIKVEVGAVLHSTASTAVHAAAVHATIIHNTEQTTRM
jgi:hypothetical protein